jgi:hypothetical protein
MKRLYNPDIEKKYKSWCFCIKCFKTFIIRDIESIKRHECFLIDSNNLKIVKKDQEIYV